MKITLKKIASLSAALFLLATAAFAQSNPTVSTNPTSLDFGAVEFDAGKSLPVAVKNTSNQPIKVGALISSPHFNANVQGTQLVNPGAEKTVNVFCVPKSETTITGTVIITAGLAGQTLKNVAQVAVECTGVNPFFRLNIKPRNSVGKITRIQVTGDPQNSQLTCTDPDNEDFPFFGCDFRLRKGAKVALSTNGSGFTGFSGGTGSASICNGTAPCSFTLNANSELTVNFAAPPPPLAKPTPTMLQVSLKKLGPGDGRVSIGPVGTPAINTDGLAFGKTISKEFNRGLRMRLIVTPNANSSIRSIVVSGASNCNGNNTCEFILTDRIFVEVGFNKK
jgi:hypothetical protein